MAERLLISVVDDDESVRESLPDLLSQFGFDATTFSSAEAFLQSEYGQTSDCLIVDVAMPEMGGLEMLREMNRRNIEIPVIFVTAHQDEMIRRMALRDGAKGCLYKPFNDTALLDALNAALLPR